RTSRAGQRCMNKDLRRSHYRILWVRGGRSRVTAGGWGGGGRVGPRLFYLGVDARIYAVPIERDLSTGEPKALFQVPGNPQYGTPTDVQFDVAPGGQRFVMTMAASAPPPEFTVIQNWQEKLRR